MREALEEHLCYSLVQECKAIAVFSLEGGLHTQYVFRSHNQYYRFLLQRFIASKATLNKCQYCGRFFVPKTKRKSADLNACLDDLSLKDNDRVFYLVGALCAEHERIAFLAGLQFGAQLMLELQQVMAG